MIRRLIIIFLTVVGMITMAKAQVTEVKYFLKYDTTDCSWGAYIFIAKGQTTAVGSTRRQFSVSYSLVLPQGATIVNLIPLAPFANNDPIGSTTVDPSMWLQQSPLDGPSATPDLSYHYVTATNGNFSYNDLKEGDTVKIFKFKVNFSNPIQNCFENVRLYRNGVDVGSEHPSFAGRNFDNGFTIGGPIQKYRGNLPTVTPPLNVEIDQDCDSGIKIDLNLEKSKCQEPYTFQWSGPGGFSSSSENIVITNNPLPGTYTVRVTDGFGCTKDTFITVALPPSAGKDTTFCNNISNYNLIGSNAPAGTWKVDTNNPPGATLGGTAGQNANVNFNSTAQGTFKFVFFSAGCEDTVEVRLQKVNAGINPNPQECFRDASFVMNAIGNGEWTLKSKPAGANDPTYDKNNQNTTVNNFNLSGQYTLTWTVENCSADVVLNVGNNCVCPVDNILSYTPIAFCGTSTSFTINGNPPTPAADSYVWEQSTNNGMNWSTAPGVSNQQNYTSTGLTTGDYLFRRRYLNTAQGCDKASNEILIKVNPLPDAGPAQSDLCADQTGGVVTMAASGIGTWDLFSNPPGSIVDILGVNSPNTTVNINIPGTYVLRWTVDGCADTTTVNIAAKPVAGADIDLFCSDPATRKTNLTATGFGSWFVPSGNPSVTGFTNANAATTEVTGLDNKGVYTFNFGTPTCFDEVMVTATNKADAGAPGLLTCVGEDGGVYATNATNGPGQWQLLSTSPFGSNLTFLGSPNNAITQLKLTQAEGIFNIKWTDQDGCTDTLMVNVTTQKSSGADQASTCQDVAANATFVMNASGTGVWSDPGGNPGMASISPSNSAGAVITGFTSPGRYTFKWTSSNGCEDFTDLFVRENPEAGNDTSLNCIVLGQGKITMSAQGQGTWTPNVNIGTSNIVDPNNPFTEIEGFSSPGTYFYRFTDLSGCASQVAVAVTPKANAGLDDNSQVCVDISAAVASLGAAGSGTWAPLATNPNALIVSTSDPNTKVRNFEKDGTYLYEWTSNGCTDTVAVIVAGKAEAGVPIDTSCVKPSDLIVRLSASGTGRWSDVFGLQYSDRNDPNATVTNFVNNGTYFLKWDNNGCFDEVVITINPPANAGANPAAQKCYSDARVTLNASPDPQGSWSSDPSNPGQSNIVDPNNFSTEVNSFKAAGTYIFIWKTIFECEDTVSVIVGGECLCTILGNSISTTSPIQYCKDAEPLTINGPVPNPAGGTYQWQVSINNSAYVDLSGETNQSVTTPKLAAGVYNYRRVYSTTSGFVCGDSSVPVKIVVANPPNAGGNYPLLCLPINELRAPLFTATPGVWRALNGGLIAQPNMASTTVGGFTQDGVYRIELEANGCKDTMEINVKIEAKAGDDKKIVCASNLSTASFIMNAEGAGTWTKANPLDVYTITNPVDSATMVNAFGTSGDKFLIWTKTNGCKDTVKVAVTTKSNAGNDISATCVSLSPPYFTNLNAPDTGVWRSLLGINIANPNSRNTAVGPFTTAGTYSFEYDDLGCLDTVNVIITEGVKINTGVSGVSCYQDTTLAISAASSGGTWTSAPTNQASTIVNINAIATKVIGFAGPGAYKYYYTKGGCVDSIVLSIGNNCNCAVAGNFVFAPTESFCGTTSITIRGSKASPIGGTTSWLLSKDNQAFVAVTGSNDTLINLATLAPGTYKIRKVYTITTCSDTTETSFVVNPTPNAGGNDTVNCVAYPFSYTARATGTGTWAPNPNASIFNASSPTTLISNINAPGTLKFYWDAGGCIDSFSLTTTLGVSVPRKDSTISCVITNAVGNLTGRGTGTWAQVGNLPSIAAITSSTSAMTTVTNLNTEGRYRFIYSNGSCSDTTAITIGKNADAGVSKTISCVRLPHEDFLSASGTGEWNQISGPISLPINKFDPKTRVENIDTAGVYTYEWTATAGCKDTVTWAVTQKPSATIDLVGSECNQTAVLNVQSPDSGTWIKDTRSAGTFTISSTTDNNIQVSNFSVKGTYYLIRSAGGCADTLTFDIDNRCGCEIDNNVIVGNTPQFCQDQGDLRLSGSSPIQGPGTYRWIFSTDSINYQTARGSSTGIFYDNPINTYTPGRYYFRRIYTLNTGGCIDTSNLIAFTIIPSSSGGTSRSVTCWNKEFTSFTAKPGIGYRWEFISSDPPQLTARVADPSSPTSRIDMFSGPGRYTYRWTNGFCETFIVVTAFDICNISCTGTIANNTINADTVTNCANLQAILFNGPTATPAGGQYLWQVLRNGAYVDAPGVNTIEDYRPDSLAVGQYSFRRIYQFGQCSDTSNQVIVNIIPAPTLPILVAPATVCAGLPLTLNTTAVPGLIYRWTGPNGFIASTASPIIPNIQTTGTGTYRLLVGNGGCFSDTAKALITVIGRPNTPVVTTNLPICDGQTLIISVNKTNGVTYAISNNFNEITNDTIYRKVNASMNDEGNYTIVSDSLGCKSTPVPLNIKINRVPIASIDVANVRCFEIDSARVSVNETAGTWVTASGNPGTASIGTGANPIVKGFSAPGNYRFVWDNGSCSDTVSLTVGANCSCIFPENVLVQPTPDFICTPTSNIFISGRGPINNTVDYKWETSVDSVYRMAAGTNSAKDYTTGLIAAATKFRRILTLKSDSLCRDTSNVVFVNLLDLKSYDIQLSNFNNPLCQGDTTTIRWLNPLSFLKYKWSTTGSIKLTGRDTLPLINIVSQSPGVGNVMLNVTDSRCSSTLLDTQIIVSEIPRINLGGDTIICSFDQALSQYTLTAAGYDKVLWNDGSTDESLVVTQEGVYSVMVTNEAGCIASDSIGIAEFCCNIHFPNVIKITSGNENNAFNIDHTDCVLSSTLKIYDRWGNLVFQSKDVNEKWDGTYNGVNVDQGVYVFIFEYEYIDQTGNQVKGKKSGDITVIR